jgi:glycosyltransferase involved in cell wall biosynthesis
MSRVVIDSAISRVGKRSEKVILIAYYQPRSVPSIAENIALFQQLSSFPISVLNLAEHRVDGGFLKIPPVVDLDDFDAIIVHNTVSYNVDNLRSLDQALSVKLSAFQGAKIILKQDEHYRFSEFTGFAANACIDCIYSIMPELEVAKTYGALLPGTPIRHMLTGYITPSMRIRFDPSARRPIDIGYRGSIMPLSFGRLCYQKRRIGDEVLRRLGGRGLSLDISSRWEDRVGGEAWFDFLSSCKAVLGVESGSGVFDLDGTLAAHCKAIGEKLGPDNGSDTYAERYLAELSSLEGRIGYFMISPRHFEAISVGAVQILFPGTYTGRMVAGRHYFELAKDYSNLDEAADFVLDTSRRTALATAAFEEVLLDERNWIETFVRELDAGLLAVLDAKGQRRKPVFATERFSKNVLVLQCHNYGWDPRRDSWYAEGAPDDVLVHQVAITDTESGPVLRRGPRTELVVSVPRKRWSPGCLDRYIAQAGADDGASSALRELYFLAHTLTLNDAALFQIYGMPQRSPHAENFRWYLRYMLDSAATLIDTIAQSDGIHALVAVNFPSLMPALIIKGLLGVPVIYEALEYWPEADPDQGEFLNAFWRQLERRLVRFADYRGTVSPPLARLMSDIYGVPFYAVPNCAPLPESSYAPLEERAARPADLTVRFLFQGNFAPHRGLEQLIRGWVKVDPRAVLLLRGPDNAFKQQMVNLARSLGLADIRVLFPVAVSTDQLISAAQADGDVGLVPYTAAGANYANCSPNKLSQYMSAGLPILANATNFVTEVIESAQCGIVVDFQREANLVEAVVELCDDNFRKRCSDNALAYFKRSYNWGAVSAPFYLAVRNAVSGAESTRLCFFPEHWKPPVPFPARVRLWNFLRLVAQRHKSYRIAHSVWHLLPVAARVRLWHFLQRNLSG